MDSRDGANRSIRQSEFRVERMIRGVGPEIVLAQQRDHLF
jgi:hypothetical protein